MNKKDISSLMEAYTEIALDKEPLSEPASPCSSEPEVNHSGPEEVKMSSNYADLKDLGREQQKMALSNLHSLRAHAYEILTVLENGVMIEPWMDEKISIATDYIITVADSIMYRK
jgi:hypothetical protein